MEPITLHFSGTDAPDLALSPGVHGLSRAADGALVRIDDAASASICYCVDRRGVWLTVGADAGGVHVNGRPVRRMAMLRMGDTVHAGGVEMVLAGARVASPPSGGRQSSVVGPERAARDPRIVLRGIGGRHHGRSFTLDRPRVVGSDRGCDIRIDDPAFNARHCRIGLQDGVLALHDLGSEEGSVVNGVPVRDALLHGGDQIVFDANQRFVIEAPAGDLRHDPDLLLPGDDIDIRPVATSQQALGRSARRLPWLLLAALLIAASLSALLLFGTSG